MNRDLQEIPRFDDNWTFLYFEKGHIEQDQKTVAYFTVNKRVPIPVETISLLMLGPGTTITHEAIKRIADSRCLVAWVGEDGVRFYSSGYSGTYSARNLLQQVALHGNDIERLKVQKRMYQMRFEGELPENVTIEQLRGMEGARVRKAYKAASELHGVEWKRREYNQDNWSTADPLNRALSAGNACLYGLVHAAILSIGCSPAIGFIHTGKQLSFVYDVADLYKTEIVVPVAFEAAKREGLLETRVRKELRSVFRQTKLIKRVIPDIMEILYGSRDTGELYAGPEGRDVAVNY
jgi:CRISPR-associated protein Cas1